MFQRGSVLRLLEWWGFPRRAWLVILVELSVIIGLSGWVVSEYLNNAYFQGYVNSLAPVLVPVVSVAFGAASASAAVILYFGTRNVRSSRETDAGEVARTRPQAKTIVRKSQQAETKVLRPLGVAVGGAKNRPSTVGRNSVSRRDGAESKSRKTPAEPDD